MLKAGRLDRKITLQTRATTQDNTGQVVGGWIELMKVWANVRHQTAKEVFQADQQKALNTVVFTIRYRSGITAVNTRAIHDGQTFKIAGVSEIGRREGLQLIGEAEDNGG